MNNIINIENLSYRYDADTPPAVSHVTLDIAEGEFFAVVGHNGSGKSTLAKHLNGLFTPTEGRVLVAGMDTADEKHMLDIRKLVGIVFQNPDNQIVTTIVEDDVAFGPENLGVPPEEIRKRVADALSAVGMEKYSKSAPHMLSGGQKQRIAIAGMLAMKPNVLVLDEATAMLDPHGRREVLRIVSELNAREGITVVLITQYMEEATFADRVAVMDSGRIAMLGTPQQVFAQAGRLESMGLGVPPTVEIRNRLIREGFPPSRAIRVDELADDIVRFIDSRR